MRDKIGFIHWLDQNTSLSRTSKMRYAKEIENISKNFEVQLYGTTKIKEIEKIFSLNAFKEINSKHDRMYSAALNHFKKYITFCNKVEFEMVIFNNKLEYKNGLINYIKTKNEKEAEDKAEQVPESTIINGREMWKRNPIYAAKTILIANYQCEVDQDHKQFVSKITKNNYVEAHHLIPIKFQKKFQYSLDIPANIVSVCASCHKQIHHGFLLEKKEILNKLFNIRNERLEKCKIKIDINELYNYYSD